MYSYRFLSRGSTDRHEILHGGSATSATGFLLFWGRIATGLAEFWASTGTIWGICFLLKHLYIFLSISSHLLDKWIASNCVQCCYNVPIFVIRNKQGHCFRSYNLMVNTVPYISGVRKIFRKTLLREVFFGKN